MVVAVGIGGWGVKTCAQFVHTKAIKKYALIDSDDRTVSEMSGIDSRLIVLPPSTATLGPTESWTDMYNSQDLLVEKSIDLISRLVRHDSGDQKEVIFFHSLGGVTGSALSVRICEDLHIPSCRITCVSLLPIREFVSPHVNAFVIASLAGLKKCVDKILLIDAVDANIFKAISLSRSGMSDKTNCIIISSREGMLSQWLDLPERVLKKATIDSEILKEALMSLI